MASSRRWSRLVAAAVLAAAGDGLRAAIAVTAPGAARVVIAATGDPTHLLPPLAYETVARDIGDQVFERLADLAPGGAPIDASAYRPALATRWERVDSLAWRFHLRPGRALAGRAAGDLGGRPLLVRRLRRLRDRRTGAALPEPASPWCRRTRPPSSSASRALGRGTALRRHLSRPHHPEPHLGPTAPRLPGPPTPASRDLVGSGPYRVAEWKRGEFVRLVADTTAPVPPKIRRAIWRFAPDPDAALNLVLSHEADLLETAGSPDRQARVARDTDAASHALRLGHLRIPRLSDRRRAEGRAASDLLGRADPAGAGARDRSRIPGALRVRARGQGAARSDVAAALDLERQHSGAAVRHGAGQSRPRRRGLAPARRARPPGGAEPARSPSTFSCRAPARPAASSPSPCRRCGRRSAPP